MDTRFPPKPPKRSENFKRLTEIVMDHVFYAKNHPERLQEIAVRMSISPEAALAVVIADQIEDEFTLTPSTD